MTITQKIRSVITLCRCLSNSIVSFTFLLSDLQRGLLRSCHENQDHRTLSDIWGSGIHKERGGYRGQSLWHDVRVIREFYVDILGLGAFAANIVEPLATYYLATSKPAFRTWSQSDRDTRNYGIRRTSRLKWMTRRILTKYRGDDFSQKETEE